MIDTSKIEMEIESPWGNYKFTGLLGFYKQGLDQLLYYQKAGNSSENE